MADVTARDAKLIQYLDEAHAKEKELETTLQGHIALTDRASYKKRLQQHLKDTRNHVKLLERRIKQLGGATTALDEVAGAVQTVARKGVALAQGSVHAVRGSSDAERMLRNARDEYADEAEEIAAYTAIEAFATSVKDEDTAKLARQIRREEERMASFLERMIPTLTRAVVTTEIPAAERRPASRSRATRRTTSRRASSSSRSATARTTARRSGTRTRSGASRSGSRARSQ